MKKQVVVLGGSGVGMIASSIIDKLPDVELVGFLNDQIAIGTDIGGFKKVAVIGSSDDVRDFVLRENSFAFFAFVGMTQKKYVWEKFQNLAVPREKYINLLDPSCVIPQNYCAIGRGVMMAPLCQLSPDTTIGDNCILLGNAFVGHDSVLEPLVSVANNASIGANVHIGRGAHVGSNATIREKVTVGEFSVVGMGSVVLRDVPPHSIVAGNPARVIRTTGQ